jgi:hypothetical protein
MRTAWEKRDHGEAHDWPGHGEHHDDCRNCGAGFMGQRASVLCRVCAPNPTPEASRGAALVAIDDAVTAALAAERARVVGLMDAAEQMLRYVAGDSAIQMTDAVHDLAAAVNRIKETTIAEDAPHG